MALSTNAGTEAHFGKFVALTINFDAFSPWIGSFGITNVSAMSRGEFAVEGTRRLLELLEHHGIRSTFFVPGHDALSFPDVVKAIVDGGHEIAHHGFVHERIGDLDPAQELSILERGIEILSEATGREPVGYRSPSWQHSVHTLGLLKARGFLYDSSLMASDFVPYWPRSGDEFSVNGPYRFGQQVPVVEIPVSWTLDDFLHFEYLRGVSQSMKSAADVFDIWREEFEYFSTEPTAGCFTLTLHSQVIGRGPRIAMLERLILEVERSAGLRFATLEEVARAWKAVTRSP